jgi:hypothetical protein
LAVPPDRAVGESRSARLIARPASNPEGCPRQGHPAGSAQKIPPGVNWVLCQGLYPGPHPRRAEGRQGVDLDRAACPLPRFSRARDLRASRTRQGTAAPRMQSSPAAFLRRSRRSLAGPSHGRNRRGRPSRDSGQALSQRQRKESDGRPTIRIVILAPLNESSLPSIGHD